MTPKVEINERLQNYITMSRYSGSYKPGKPRGTGHKGRNSAVGRTVQKVRRALNFKFTPVYYMVIHPCPSPDKRGYLI